MNEEEKFLADSAVRFGVVGNFLTIGYMLILVGAFWNRLPPELPLFYSLPWGEEWLVPKNGLLMLVGTMAVLAAVDNLWAMKLFGSERILSRYLVLGSLTTLVLMAVNLTKIIEVLI